MASLILTNEGLERLVFPIGQSIMLLGRNPQAGIFLDSADISTNHASITFLGGYYVLKDAGSTNGTYVNGSRINPGSFYAIQPNASIRIGDTVINLGQASGAITVVRAGSGPFYNSGGSYPDNYRSGMPSSIPSVNVDVNLGPRGGLGNEMEYSYHANKSYVGPAVLATCLYYFGFFIVGLVVNILFLNSAKLTKSIIQRDPPGYVFLQAILWIHIALVVIGVIIILAVGGFGFM